MSASSLINNWKDRPKIHFSQKQQFVPIPIWKELKKMPESVWKNYSPLIPLTEAVYDKYTLPFKLYPYQQAWVDAFGDASAAGMWFEVGAGKTATAVAAALYQRLEAPGHTIVVMPPILLTQWKKYLDQIPEVGSTLVYRGTPQQREAMNLDVDFLLMSLDIFKNDFKRIFDFFYDRSVTLIVDEAVSVKNPNTSNHKAVRAFHERDISIFAKEKRTRSDAKVDRQAKKAVERMAVEKLVKMLEEKYGS